MTLWSLIKSNKKLAGLTLLFGWATLAMNIGLQSTSSYLIAKAATRPSTILLLWVPIVAVRFFGTGRGVVRYCDRLSGHNLTLAWLRDLRVKVYQWVEPRHRNEWDAVHTGDVVLRLSADVDTLQTLVISVWEPVAVGLLALTMVMLVGRLLNGSLAWAIVLVLVLSGTMLSWLSHWLSGALSASLVPARARLGTAVVDSWHGLIDAIAFRQQDRVLQAIQSMDSAWARTKVRLHRLSGLVQGLMSFVTWAALWAILVVAIRLVDRHQLPGILLPVVVLLTLASFDLINGLPNAFQAWGQITAARQRLLALRPQETAKPLEPPPTLSDRPTVALRDVSVRYAVDGGPALTHIDLLLRPGQHCALVGPNGSGKSTLIEAVAGLIEVTSGSIAMDAVAYRRSTLERVRQRLGVVNQTPHIFDTTLEENLRVGRLDASHEDLRRAITLAGLEPLIESLPQGLGSRVGSRGTTVSGGEIKRIAIARVVLKDAPILLLDEPTEGLDPESARTVLARLLLWAEGRTVLWATHHLSNLDLIDQVIVMDGGHIREVGPFSRLRHESAWIRTMMLRQQLVLPSIS